MSTLGSTVVEVDLDLEKEGHTGRRSWRERASRLLARGRLLRVRCPSCLRAQEDKDFSLNLQDNDDDGGDDEADDDGRDGYLITDIDNLLVEEEEEEEEEEVEMGGVHIIVEDLGLINPSFTLSSEDIDERDDDGSGSMPRYGTMGRSASSVSASQRAIQRKRNLAPLSSLPLQPRVALGSLNSEEDSLLFAASDGGLLTPPVINLIPPTPSDVDTADDDQFFDINSEEDSVGLTSGSEGVDSVCSLASAELDTFDSDKEERSTDQDMEEKIDDCDVDVVVEDCPLSPPAMETGNVEEETSGAVTEQHPTGEDHEEKSMWSFLRSTFQVAPLPEYPRKNDLGSKDSASSHDLLKAEKLRLLPLSCKMETSLLHQRKPAARTFSLGETMPRSHTFHAIGQSTDNLPEEEESPRQRRITVASYIPQSKDQNGNFAGKGSLDLVQQESNGQTAKALAELNTEEVCQWFSGIGLHKCLPLIRGADLCGSHIASIDLNTLDLLQVSDLNDREKLLSAIYEELHPPNVNSQKVDSLLATFGSHSVESFTAALVSMTKSHSSPHVGNINQCSFRFRQRTAVSQRKSKLIEITIKVCSKEQIVHLRTPKDTTMGKVLESCLKMLGKESEKDTFALRATEDDLPMDQQVGSLLGSDSQLIELQLCEKVKPIEAEPSAPEVSPDETSDVESEIQHCNDDDKLQELNQQVESLQSVILQVQELHHGLVAFCGELRSMDYEQAVEQLSCAELEERLAKVQGSLQDKRQGLQALKDSLSIVASLTTGKVEVRLLEKMKLNCQVFQDEITLIHLNRQVTCLQEALEESHAKEERAEGRRSTLCQLVSLQSPAMLLATQESTRGPDGPRFTAQLIRGQGLVVVGLRRTEKPENSSSSLSVGDRLVEVNGVSVLGSSEDELQALLQQQPTAHIIVLRRPPPLPQQQTPVAACPEQHQQQLGHRNSAPWSPGVCTATTR